MNKQTGMRLVLGSGSPRRAQLLRQLQLEFEQIVSAQEEPAPTGEDPGDQAIHCAQIKARAVRELLSKADREQTIVIGADTMVVVDDKILGKPRDAEAAGAMLRLLSGRSHTVCTGVCLLGPGALEQRESVLTEVWMKSLSTEAIDVYIASEEPMDKAGAYGIQGLGARFVERINGCYYNVVGLPLARLTVMLDEAGFR
jgi:septum formation protein